MWATVFDCGAVTSCSNPQMVNVPPGDYCVKVELFTANWQPICDILECVTVPNGGDPCDNAGGDSDGDGVCNDDDCKPFDAFFPATPGTPCNDGNPNTNNDMVQADGCSCAGTPTQGCENVTWGGTIGFGNNCDASTIVCNAPVPSIGNCDAPSGGSGALEIIWLKAINNPNCVPPSTTVDNIDNDPFWSIIPGATGLTLNPGTISQKTCYLRCARRAGCDTYIESNIIMASIDPNCGGGGDPDCDNDIDISTTNSSIIVSGLDGAPFSGLQVFTANWTQQLFNCSGNCNGTETINVPSGDYIVLAKYFNASWQIICERIETVSVGGGDPCANAGGDSDGDGVCNDDDCAPNNANLPTTPGTACNDGDPNTNNDVIQSDGCTCAGTPTTDPCANSGGDSDNDGVCDDDDCAPFNASLPTTPGTTCNDGDPNTINDMIQADGCTCAGTPDTGNPCDPITVTTSSGKITVSGHSSPIVLIKVFNNVWATVFDCGATTNCSNPQMVNVPPGDYCVKVEQFTANWQPICDILECVTVPNGGDPCDNAGGDSDGDGVCNDDDCAPNNANLPTTPGTACNDGNPNTNNDVIQSDGCTCAGTPTTDPCANAGGDSDGDGVCNDDDCRPFDAFYPAAPGTPCNDGNPNTSNDMVQADGCSCMGEMMPDECDSDTDGCSTVMLNGIETNNDGSRTYEFKVTHNCNQALSFAAFQLPDNETAIDIGNSYNGWNTSYGVENPTNNPFYSIKFETNGEGIKNGEMEIFRFTLAASAPILSTIKVQVKSSTNKYNLELSTANCDNNNGGGTGDCNNITITDGPGSINISGLDGAFSSSVQVFSSDWSQVLFDCFANCNANETINLPAGSYIVLAKYYDSSWTPQCEKMQNVSVSSNLIAAGQFEFEAVKELEHVELYWLHNRGDIVNEYTIEHSLDGLFFEPVSGYASTGTDNVETYFGYDLQPATGDNYYRIRMEMLNGVYTYSEVKQGQLCRSY